MTKATKSSTQTTVGSYSFYSKDLNTKKFDLFVKKAEAIRDYKNALSLEVSSKLLYYAEMSKFDFIKLFGTQTNWLNPSSSLRGNEIQKAVTDVFNAYQNKITCVKQKMIFIIQKSVEVEYYKRNTKNNKKGDVISFEIKTKSTPLTKSLSFLARYGAEDTLEYVNKRLEDKEDDKKAFYKTLKGHIEKLGLERLLKLALEKRERILHLYNHPIEFTSLSYRSAVQTEVPFLQNSKNKNFCNGMVCIPGFLGVRMFVPVSFNINHHGHLNQYKSWEYTICIDKKRKRVRFICTKEIPNVISPEGTEYLGVDTNIKHNLFATSEGSEVDIDRDLFQGYIAFLRKHQEKKEHSKGEDQQMDLWQERILCMLKKKAREIVDLAIKNNKDHIIMEDLSSFRKSFVKSEEFQGFKYTRLAKLLRLSSLNKIVKGICKKLNVRLTLIPSHYTSQWCFHCGHIDRSNRPNQETFSCVCCGHTANADFHSSQAIKLIGSSDVLRSSMLVKDKSSDWIPKKLAKGFIKKQLEDITPKLAFQLDCQELIV
jgi:transposase